MLITTEMYNFGQCATLNFAVKRELRSLLRPSSSKMARGYHLSKLGQGIIASLVNHKIRENIKLQHQQEDYKRSILTLALKHRIEKL